MNGESSVCLLSCCVQEEGGGGEKGKGGRGGRKEGEGRGGREGGRALVIVDLCMSVHAQYVDKVHACVYAC